MLTLIYIIDFHVFKSDIVLLKILIVKFLARIIFEAGEIFILFELFIFLLFVSLRECLLLIFRLLDVLDTLLLISDIGLTIADSPILKVISATLLIIHDLVLNDSCSSLGLWCWQIRFTRVRVLMLFRNVEDALQRRLVNHVLWRRRVSLVWVFFQLLDALQLWITLGGFSWALRWLQKLLGCFLLARGTLLFDLGVYGILWALAMGF